MFIKLPEARCDRTCSGS